jgi:hypothetical protein
LTRYSPQIALAARQLKAFGRIVTLQRVAVEDANLVTDLPADSSARSTQVAALLKPPSRMTEQSYSDQFKSGALVLSQTRQVTLAGVDIDGNPIAPINAGDLLLVDGETWRFVGASVVAPDGTAIVHNGTIKK